MSIDSENTHKLNHHLDQIKAKYDDIKHDTTGDLSGKLKTEKKVAVNEDALAAVKGDTSKQVHYHDGTAKKEEINYAKERSSLEKTHTQAQLRRISFTIKK